jgi:hypothetical protein
MANVRSMIVSVVVLRVRGCRGLQRFLPPAICALGADGVCYRGGRAFIPIARLEHPKQDPAGKGVPMTDVAQGPRRWLTSDGE